MPSCGAFFLALVSARVRLIFSRVSSDTEWPLRAADQLAMCSADFFLPLCDSDFLRLISAQKSGLDMWRWALACDALRIFSNCPGVLLRPLFAMPCLILIISSCPTCPVNAFQARWSCQFPCCSNSNRCASACCSTVSSTRLLGSSVPPWCLGMMWWVCVSMQLLTNRDFKTHWHTMNSLLYCTPRM